MGLGQELQEPSGQAEVRSTTTSPAAAAPPASASSLMVFEGHRGEALPSHSVVMGWFLNQLQDLLGDSSSMKQTGAGMEPGWWGLPWV